VAKQSRSTIPEAPPLARLKRARLGRRIGITILVVFVGMGAVGLLGVRSDSVSASGDGITLEVQYPKVARPGLESPWAFRVSQEGGFGDSPVTIATSLAWLSMFDENGRNPTPSAEYVDGDMVVWEFDPPPGETFTFEFDARLGPSVQQGMTAVTELREGNVAVLSVTYTMRVMP
jgi:hypothetical protein